MKTKTVPTDQAPAKQGCCSKVKACCKHAGRAREISLAVMTGMATIGPKRFRPYFQQALAVISVVAATIQFFRNRRG